ncbi:hypothetical protein P700755_000879 [Psychroflexus torquis ATCC 700755]|uniref:GmrSD restriction endonucleases N-terminal domain-containing protein n=1 Tax=Psychroflexus torquis (strain ATCC 700755 / CIP 106069 / ACAM 623) TaxID=313595 RepID=K4IDA5_PSYTT|nr:DUF262 domain-containing protein [Psychroflexus torquis]AFU67858.1 hypothetical protein P700755_000879 [Psychroflexus torquis ATCC 700755]
MEENNQNIDENQILNEPLEAGDGTEKEQIDDSLELMEKPFDPTLIKIETNTPNLNSLIRRIEDNSIQMNTSNYFQRGDDLWNKTQQSRLIESILIRFPLPAFFFDASDNNNWLIVDGLQRLSSIRNFAVLKNHPLTNLEFLTHLNGKYWDDLPANLKRDIEEAQVVIYKIMPGTPPDVKFNIFKRINTGGLVLESQEIRHALFQGRPSEFISELAKNEDFLKATEHRINPRRMLDRDFANRFLSFYMLGVENYGTKEFGQDLDSYMSKAMATIYDKKEEELSDIKTAFSKSMKLAKAIFKDEAFRKVYKDYQRKPPINKALFDTLSTQLALLTDKEQEVLKSNKGKFKRLLKNTLAEDEHLFTSLTSSTGNKTKTQYRHNKVKELIQDVIKDRI